MCLAIHKPSGVPFNEFLEDSIRNSYKSNRDGIGFALKRNHQIIVKKGLYTPDTIIEMIKELNPKPEEEMLIHLRTGTSGKVTDTNCHPFVLTKSKERCWAKDIKTDDPVLIHNGMFSSQEYDVTDSEYSDTFHLTHQYFANLGIRGLMMLNLPMFKRLTKDIIGTFNKVAIMFPTDRPTIWLGPEIHENGCIFSNGSYKSYTTQSNHTNSNHSKTYAYSTSEKRNLLPALKPDKAINLAYITNKKISIKNVNDLEKNLVLEVSKPVWCAPTHEDDESVYCLRSGFIIKLIDNFVGTNPDTNKKGLHWRAVEIGNDLPWGDEESLFSISEEQLLDTNNFKIILDTQGNKIVPKGKLVSLNDSNYQLFRGLFSFPNMSRSLIKKVAKASVNASRSANRKAYIQIGNKKHGPFPEQYYKLLLTQWDEYEKDTKLFTAGQ